MRRADRQVSDLAEMRAFLERCEVCRLAMIDPDGGRPYIVPLNFAFEMAADGEFALYFHGAAEGRKVDILRKNPAVCFELDGDHALTHNEDACTYSYRYSSVIGDGEAEFLTVRAEKLRALNILMRKFAGRDGFDYPDEVLARTAVFRVTSREYAMKRNR